MILKERAHLVSLLLGSETELDQRIDAARALADDTGADTIGALLLVACSDDEDTELQTAAGESLAYLYASGDGIDRAPLEQFSGPAYIGFDTVAAQILNGGDALP